jgi:hypothetical protein
MGTWRHIFRTLFMILLLNGAGLHAQEGNLTRANQLYRAKSYEAAALTIDSAITHPETNTDFMTWTIRAYIYIELHKRTDRHKLYSALRDTVVSSLKISNSLNPDSLFIDQNKKLFKNLAQGYRKIARDLLQDSLNYDRSFYAYNKFKELNKYFDPNETYRSMDIEYYLAAGSIFADIFNNDNNNAKAGEIAKVSLFKVLELQPDEPHALMNIGLMYYNQAVTLNKSLDYGADFTQIDIVQDNMVKLAKQAEQQIIKVYQADHSNQKAMRALFYIYRMLGELAKSDEFKNKLKEKGIDVDKEERDLEQKEKEKDPNKGNTQDK